MQKIVPFLWFNDNLEDAVTSYISAFKNSKAAGLSRSGDALPGEPGKVFTGSFELAGLQFNALNGGPMFQFSPSNSFFVQCETETELDELWNKLAENGKVLMELNKYPFSPKYGWIQDKYGVSWQLNLTSTPQKIAPCLMFQQKKGGSAEDAINLYMSLFNNSEMLLMARYEEGEPGLTGTIKHAAFVLDGVEFKAMDSHLEHNFTFTPAISYFVNCTTQEEVDHFWEKLSEGGRKDRCGWLQDKYGVSWQIVPTVLGELLYSADKDRSKRVMQAMLKMTKLDIKGLEEA